jgi:hypothetical protein
MREAGMACEAERRPQYNDPGWTCDGTGLIKLLDGPRGIAVVAPAWAVGALLAEEPWAGVYDPQVFTGGDHYHAVLRQPEVQVSKR